MYDELVKRLREDKSWIEQGTTDTEHEIAKHIQQAVDVIEELSKMVSADDAKAYLDRNVLMNTLMEHKKSFDLRDRYGDYGMGFSEAIKVVAMTYPVYMSEPPKEG